MVSFSSKQSLRVARFSVSPEISARKRHRILFLDHTAVLGGGEIALLNLLQHLDTTIFEPIVLLFSDGPLVEELRKSGIETQVLSLDADVTKICKDSLGVGSVLRIKMLARTLGFTLRLASRIRALDPDIVHTNSLKADLIGGVASRLARRRLVWHVRDRIADDYLPSPVAKLFRQLCRCVPHYVIANSQSTLSTLLPEQATQANSETRARMGVVHSGIELHSQKEMLSITKGNAGDAARQTLFRSSEISVVHDGVKQQEGNSADYSTDAAIRIGLVGRISPWKGQHIFLEAAAKVRERFPAARFQIIGSVLFSEHDYERQIRQQVLDLGLEESVEFLGFRRDIPELVSQMSILVHASTTGEPFGQVIAEGMACSKPVVATNGGGVPEIVEDGVTGLLVPMNDADSMANAICQLLSDPDKANQMGLQGRQRVEKHFAIQSTAHKVESIYANLLREKRRPAKWSGSRTNSVLPGTQPAPDSLRSGQGYTEEATRK